jgi:[acyl-carrier-protein] S-malonyltransferase
MVSPANINTPEQVVIAGEASAVERALALLKDSARFVKKLAVSVPSHCLLMQPAAEKMKTLFEEISFCLPSVPVIQNVDAVSHAKVQSIKEALYRQLFLPVQWVATILHIQKNYAPAEMLECGPGKVLTGLNKRMSPIPTLSIEALLK